MKNVINRFIFIFFSLSFIVLASETNGGRDFQQRVQNTLFGDVRVIGNTVLCILNRGQCVEPTNNAANNTTNLQRAPISSSTLILPENSIVEYARIYWQGRRERGAVWDNPARNSAGRISLKNSANSSYTQLTADIRDFDNFNSGGNIPIYSASADAKSVVNASGTYQIDTSSFYTITGTTVDGLGTYGAWVLVVIYSNPNTSTSKNIVVFDGFKNVNASTGTVDITASGFLVPREGVVDSNLFVFAGEGDKFLAGDELLMRGETYNTTFTRLGTFDSRVDVAATRNPNLINNNGIDIHSYSIGTTSTGLNILQNNETAAHFRFRSTQDAYFPSLLVFSTEVFRPKLCYDYAYRQENRFFTENNDGSKLPRLSTDRLATGIIINQAIEMKIYIKNLIDSDMSISNLKVHVNDINTSQATYIRGTTKVNLPGKTTPELVGDTALSVSDSYIREIPIGHLSSLEHFYIYYKLNPLLPSLDMPLHIDITYNITGVSSDYTDRLGSQAIGLCSDSNFLYTPKSGIFNIVHNSYYNKDLGGALGYYNLPTQIVKREGNFKLISLDEINQNELKGQSTIVAVELIDAAAFHDTDASCHEPLSSISEKIWITIDNESTSAMFDQQALQNAIGLNNTLTSSADFYKNARENTAFRLSYNVAPDSNNSLVQTELQSDGTYKILNFSEIVQTVGSCTQPVRYPLGNSGNTETATQTSQACGNSGNSISKAHLQACMECIYGINTKQICSRDNFSLRPEAFMMHIDDQNQTNPANQTRLTTGYSGNSGATAAPLSLAAGYNYNIEVDAVNHQNNIPSAGYTKTFTHLIPDDSAQHFWNSAATGCNDVENKPLEIRFLNGKVDNNSSVGNVGEYQLTILDTTWTNVDHNPQYMTHHTGAYFMIGADCLQNSSATQPLNSPNLNGCNISSNHTNPSNSLKYNDYFISYHPYKFGANSTLTLGLNNSTTSSFIYMADIDRDENMSVHLNTTITAQGFNGNATNNYVTGCYSKPLGISIGKTPTTSPTLIYKHITHNRDINATNIFGQYINQTIPAGSLTQNPNITTPAQFFQKDQNGTINLFTHLNYHREINATTNPEDISFTTITLSDPATLFSANLKNEVIAKGEFSLNQRVLHYYGKTNAQRQRFVGNSGNALIYYEIFCDVANGCDKSLLPNGVDSNITNDPRWFVNTTHTTVEHGVSDTDGIINQKNADSVRSTSITNGLGLTSAALSYTSSYFPYKATMENNASNWLIYNKYNANALANEFEVEFDLAGKNWAGVSDTNTSTNSTASPKANRRVIW